MKTEIPKVPRVQRLTVNKTYKLYIDGKFPRTESGRSFSFTSLDKKFKANLCKSSRKDFRDAVTAARSAFLKWSQTPVQLRGQILYRVAEMLEGRKSQFVQEIVHSGFSQAHAKREVEKSIDRLIYFAGWADKYQQVFSSVNPVASSHFNFSVLEPMGVVATKAPESSPLLGLISVLAPAFIGGNTTVILTSRRNPLSGITFSEVLQSSDVPPGTMNILTGDPQELLIHFARHMDVNAMVLCNELNQTQIFELKNEAASNVKRVIILQNEFWNLPIGESPQLITKLQEIKTTWHPIGF